MTINGQLIEVCRCGYTGEGDHLCHRCHIKPGSRRFVAYPTALAGAQPKLGAYETNACDECWAQYTQQRKAMEHERDGNKNSKVSLAIK